MPVVVGPTPTTPSTPVLSADLVLTVTPRPEWAAVLVKVDFTKSLSSSVAATVWTTSVTRSDGLTIRGLDRLVAPRGVCVGWDQEFPTGTAATWTARAYSRAGTLVATSASVSVNLPRTTNRAWLKPLNQPRLTRQIEIRAYPEWSDDAPMAVQWAVGARYPSVALDKRRSATGQLTVTCRDKASELGLIATSDVGGVFLLQPSVVSTEPDVFVVLGARKRARQFEQSMMPQRTFTFDITEVARPDTTGSSIPIPGLTFTEAPSVPWSSLSGRLVDYTGA